MPITKRQALELADKWLLEFGGRIVLRDNIRAVSKSAEGWYILAVTTPMTLGMKTEIFRFSINAETGEVGASLSYQVPNSQTVLKEIDEKDDLDQAKKEQIREKIREVEKETKKEPIDKKRIGDIKKWFEDNAPWLKDVISIIAEILKKF